MQHQIKNVTALNYTLEKNVLRCVINAVSSHCATSSPHSASMQTASGTSTVTLRIKFNGVPNKKILAEFNDYSM